MKMKMKKKNENEKTNFSNEIKNEDMNINMNIAGYYDNIRNNRSHVSTQNPDTSAGSRAQNPDTGAGSRAQNPDTGAGSRGKDPLTGYWDQYTGNQEFWEDDDGPPALIDDSMKSEREMIQQGLDSFADLN
mmetsp:Transcript_28245/g.27080  ORF Transcript_28245/g.27080 Transcript_28245/m.27080 type:complete len:131 (+) Transcript_28245:15-407(+)